MRIFAFKQSSIKFILKKLRDLFVFIFANIISKKPRYIKDSIIILRSDAIGDYLLFRNFLKEIKIAYPSHNITLLGNITWSELALYFDKENIDHFIFFHPVKLTKNPLYAVRFLHKLKQNKYSIFINTLYSRDSINFLLSTYINADFSTAPKGDCIDATKSAKKKNDKIYTKIYPSKQEILFEFYRNMEFFEHFLHKKLKTRLEISYTKILEINEKFTLKTPYSILFIGASTAFRKWNIESFGKVGIYLIEKYAQNIVICGGKEDKENADKLQKILESKQSKIYNLAGLTSLLDLTKIVHNSKCLITNETSCAHLGAILDTTNVFVVSNGNHLGRFIPYPKELREKYYPIFHHFIRQNIDKYEELSNEYAYKSTLDINEISFLDVIEMINLTLQKEKI